MKHIKTIIISLVAIIGLAGVMAPTYAMAASTSDKILKGVNAVDDRTNAEKNANTLPKMIKNVINIMLYIIGAISVVMIVVGGIRYTTSGGDSNSVKAAKDTIMYAVIGLVVALIAFAVVNFVLTSLT